MNFKGKVVIVTGAGRGIGRSIATHYAKEGASVVIAEKDEQSGLELEQALCKEQLTAKFIKTDVRKETDILQLISQSVECYGTIDILINNAGVSRFKSIYELSLEEWDDIIHTNLRSVFLCSREVAKIMQNQGGGSIVNIASTRALMSEPNSEAYAASKGGIVAITHALAASLSKNRIQVNAISPGWIETGNYEHLNQTDHNQHFSLRVGRPDDIARTCLFLTNPRNNFINGENLVIDGGMTKKMIYEE